MSTERSYSGLLYGKQKQNAVIQKINKFINSDMLYIAMAALCALAFTFSLEIAVYAVYSLLIAFISLFGERAERLLIIIPFYYIAPSVIHNPAVFDDSIFLQTIPLICMGVPAVIAAALIVAVIIRTLSRGGGQRPILWSGYLVLGVAYMCSGAFSSGATLKNFGFAFIEFVSISALYFVGSVIIDTKNTDKAMFAKIGCAMGIVLLVEVFDIYMFSGVFNLGYLNRGNIYTGWGVYNNIGNMLCFCIPCAFYMMYRADKRKILWFLYACLLMVAVVLTTSRGSMLTGAFVFVASLALIIFKGNRPKLIRKIVLITVGIGIIALIIFCFMWLRYDFIRLTVEKILKVGVFNDANRFKAWNEGIAQFLNYPIFGKGFYECSAYLFHDGVAGMLPARWHNTVIQLLASCGIVGILAYIFHRVQTIKLFWKLKTVAGRYIALSILAILIGTLTDNHFFNIGPGLIYGLFLSIAQAQFAGKTEAMEQNRGDIDCL